MAINHEIIKNVSNLPVKIFSFSAKNLDKYIPKHWHQNTELLYCIKGSLKVWENKAEYLLEEGDLIVINPNQIHSTQSPEKNHILVIQFPLTFLKQVSRGEYNRLWLFSVNTLKNKLEDKTLFSSLDKIDELNNTNSIQADLESMVEVYHLLSELLRFTKVGVDNEQIRRNDKKLDNLTEVISYINENYQSTLYLENVSNHFNFSANYFSRYFKEYLGVGFTDYVNTIRLDDAFKKLIHSNQDLLSIAMDTGFVNYRNFYNAFVRTYQMSPRKYRDLYQKK